MRRLRRIYVSDASGQNPSSVDVFRLSLLIRTWDMAHMCDSLASQCGEAEMSSLGVKFRKAASAFKQWAEEIKEEI